MDSGSSSSSVPYTVFISHAGEDKATIAIPLRERLLKRGISAFVDEADMLPGTEAKWEMKQAMETSKIGVIVVSPEFIVKEWPMKELMCFLKRREEYLCGRNGGLTVPMVMPFFYRLSVKDLYDEPRLDRKDGDGVLLHEKSRFYERQKKGEVEANILEIEKALRKLQGIVGVRNTVEANNDSSYDMSEKRSLMLDKLCEEICRVELEMMETQTSRDVGQGVESDSHGAKEVRVAPKENESATGAQFVKRDAVEAKKLDRHVIEVEDANATYNLAQMLENGADGAERNAVEAEKLYRLAIDAGHADSMNRLARMLTIGAEGVERNAVEAEELYLHAIRDGNVNAMCGLAAMLECGADGVKQDAKEAENLYRRAVESGDITAIYNLAMMLQNGADGVEADAMEAEQLYHRAIDAGEVDAMYHLACMLTNGAEGLERDAVRAEQLYRRATEEGHVNAMFSLALILEKGGEGVERDAVEAENLYRRAIDAGHVDALYHLAVMLATGAEGVERNAVEAKCLYRRAIDDGHIDAMYSLAVMLTSGAEGVEQDPAEAEKLQKLYRRANDARSRG